MSTTHHPNGDGIHDARTPSTWIELSEGSTDASVNNLLFWRPSYLINALKWGEGVGTGATLTTSFVTSSQYFDYTLSPTFAPPLPVYGFSAAQQDAAWNAMTAAAVANIRFLPVTETASGVGDIRWANTGDATVNTAFTAFAPTFLPEAGDIWFGPTFAQADPTLPGMRMTYMHELGHALGLMHPHDTVVPAEPGEDQLKYSLMSYRDFAGDDIGLLDSEFFPTSFMLNDILALQFLYGANTTAYLNSDTYAWGASTHVYQTIWDAGGIDTISASGQSEAVVLNLNPGSWSEIGAAFFNGQSMVRDCLTIAYGSVIENATGSSHDDVLIGNNADNRLDGGDGDDTLDGGAGNDMYLVNAPGDNVVEAAGNGTDTVLSAASWTLSANVENLTLTGSGAVNGTGNTLDNTLAGNIADNTLDGGEGDDTYRLSVGAGNDQATDSVGADRIVFADITSTQVTASRQNGDIVLRINANDSIRFSDGGGSYSVEQFEFMDGVKTSIWVDELLASPSGIDKTITTLEDTSYTVTIADFGFTAADGGGTLDSIRIDTVPAAGTLTLNGTNLAAGQLLAVADIAGGALVFAPTANAFGSGYANVTFSVMDQTGAFDSYPNRLTFNVTSVNDVPVGSDTVITFNEDTYRTMTLADFGFSDGDVGDALAGVRIDLPPEAGGLQLGGSIVTAGQVVTAADIAANKLFFWAGSNAHGANFASFTFSVKDPNGAFDPTPNRVTFNVTSINDLPTSADKSVSFVEDSSYTVTLADFAFTDSDSGDTMSAVRIDTPTLTGGLTRLNGVNVTAGQIIDAADIAAGGLIYTPPANGTATGNLMFSVKDQNGGFDASPNKLTFLVIPVNDLPSGADKTLTVAEDNGRYLVVADFGFTDVDSTQGGVRIDTLPELGILKLNSVAVTAGQYLTVADIGTTNLAWYNTAPNAYGSNFASFTFSVKDQSTFDPTPNRITIDVTSVNDTPTGTDNAVTFNEDTSYIIAAADFGFSDADAGDTLGSVRIDTLPSGSLKLNGIAVTALQTITVADITAGKLVFTPPANASGTGYTSFTFRVKDQVGGMDAAANRLTFNVAAINDAPTGLVSISGAPNPGQTLTVNSTLADADGLGALSYQWLRGATPIAGATSTSYVLVSADIGSTVSVRVSYVDARGTAESSTSAPTNTVYLPANGTGSVTISGNATQLQTLTAVTTTLADPNGLGTLKYQWLHGGVAIAGATAKTYTLVQSDVGTRVSVQVSYVDGAGTPESKISGLTSNVVNVNDLPTGAVSIVGQGSPGQTLASDVSKIADPDGLGTFSYQWLRGGVNITGATSASYTLKAADEGAAITVRVKFVDGFGANETVTSAAITAGRTINGTAGADTLTGSAGADIVSGAGGNDTINGGSGDDFITGGLGNDSITGGSGVDVLAISSARSATAVTITSPSALTATVQTVGVGGDGVDSTTGLERFKFTDMALAIDLNGAAGVAAKVVGALLGAVYVQDRDVMGSVLDQADTGMTQAQLAAYVASTALFATLAGSHSNTDFVSQVFESVYLRPPTPAESLAYVDALNTGAQTQGSLGGAMSDASENLVNIDFVGLQSSGFSYTY